VRNKLFRVLTISAMAPVLLFQLSAVAATPAPGGACAKSGQVVHMNAKIFTCIKSGKKLFWSQGVPENSSSSAGQGAQQTATGALQRIGMSCPKNGIFGFTGGALAVCKNNVVAYALLSDLPPVPASGYTSRPSWYPSLSQQLGEKSEPTCSSTTIRFTSPVIPNDQLAPSIPYGSMVGGHVTPIDHAYLGVKSLFKDPSARLDSDYVPVTSPAAGTITSLQNLGSPTSIRVVIDHGCNVASVYMVLNKLSGVLAQYATELSAPGASKSVSIKVKAGDEFGRQRDNPLDFNVWDGTHWLSGFANPYSYTSGDAWKPFTVDPLPYFEPAIRNAMEAMMQRTAAPRIGKIDYDVRGTAAGNWFLDGTSGYSGHFTSEFERATSEIPGGAVSGKNIYSWSHLAIAPHEVDVNKWIFSTGWWNDPAGDPQQFLINLSPGQPTPDKLTASSGMVVYQLTSISRVAPSGTEPLSEGAPYPVGYSLVSGSVQGIVAMQVNQDKSLTVEIDSKDRDIAQFLGFSSAKRIYRR